MIELITIANVAVLGVFAGSMLTEAFLLVPFFQSLNAKDFYILHHDFGPRLYRYYAPITVTATLVPMLTAGAVTVTDAGHSWLFWLTVIISLTILSTYFFYFRKANLAFAEKRVSLADLELELTRWSHVHKFRTTLALVSFLVSIFAALSVCQGR